jgi:hypothetical protein
MNPGSLRKRDLSISAREELDLVSPPLFKPPHSLLVGGALTSGVISFFLL